MKSEACFTGFGQIRTRARSKDAAANKESSPHSDRLSTKSQSVLFLFCSASSSATPPRTTRYTIYTVTRIQNPGKTLAENFLSL